MAFNPNTIWLSHTSLGDFEKCHKLYYLRNWYRDNTKGNNFRIQVASPYLSLGQAVHDAIDHFVTRYPVNIRTKDKLFHEYDRAWNIRPSLRGGFKDPDQEKYFKDRGEAMLERFFNHPHFASGETLRIDFPKLPILGEDTAILVGNFDWLEKTESGLHILDFKTGTSEEEGSIQLPLYALLAQHNLKLPVEKVSYWYLDRDDEPIEIDLGNIDNVLESVKAKAIEIESLLATKDFVCKQDPCTQRDCLIYQKVASGTGQHLFTDYTRKREVFYVN